MTANSNQAAALDAQGASQVVNPRSTAGSPHGLYIPSLDGIRAISFFLVFVAHAGLGGIIPGGFGVSVFFFLSGYLITTLLRGEFARYGRISLSAFYLRRVLRIFPPLYIALALALALTLIDSGPSGIPVAGTVAQALQVANYYEIFAADPSRMAGTNVLWSLAVEEHFYLVFPVLFVWMSARLQLHQQAAVLLALCAVALAWRCTLVFLLDAEVLRTYYGTDTRFDCILFGAVFAVIANPVYNDPSHDWLIRRVKWMLPLCIVVLLGTFLLRSDQFRETFRYTLQGLALMPLFAAAIHYQKSWPVVLLNLPVIRFLGVLSYTLYLCHAMITEGVKSAWTLGPFLTSAVSLALTVGFATLVHYWVERPCAALRRKLSKAIK